MSTNAPREFPFDALGSDCVLHLCGPAAQVEAAATAAIDEVLRIERRYSRYRDDSVLSAINRAAALGAPEGVEVDEETAALLDCAFALHGLSGGLFDVTSGLLRRVWSFATPVLPEPAAIAALLPGIGMDKLDWRSPRLGFHRPGLELDFGGLGKEYAVDRVAEVCAAHGIARGLVDLGGDLRVLGPPEGAPAWPVGIRDPDAPETAICVVDMVSGALATSGDYERFIDVDGRRYCHILDPRTGWPAQGLRSVSVRAERCLLAGGLTTVAMLMGEAGKAFLARLGVDHLWIDASGAVGGPLGRQPLRP